VATGNIYEDIRQARAAARQGADIIAVIRSTGQSLLDYVPYGATTEGFGGTCATQENFRLMRQGEELEPHQHAPVRTDHPVIRVQPALTVYGQRPEWYDQCRRS